MRVKSSNRVPTSAERRRARRAALAYLAAAALLFALAVLAGRR